jgi:malate dehydrogenase
MAYAGYKFAEQLIAAAFEGKKGVVAPSYVYVADHKDVQKEIGQDLAFFSVPVELGVRSRSRLRSLSLSQAQPTDPLYV